MPDGNPVVRLNEVRFAWPGQPRPVLALDAFAVGRGERLLIRGPSGSGKTTLLSLLGGVIVPQQGSVTVLDTALERLRSARRDRFRAAHIGFIFQLFNLIPYLSLLDNVLLPCRFSAQRRQRTLRDGRGLEDEARRLLERLGLNVAELLDRPVTELSVGQQQRVAAARALIGAPELVIADEPTSALDHDHRQAFLELLFQELAAAGSTLVFVSHDPSLEPLFDRCLALAELNGVGVGSA